MTSIETDDLTLFVEGWAQYLADASLGLTWEPTDPYTPDEIGLWLMSFPTDPAFDGSKVVALTPTVLLNDSTYADSTFALQVKSRCPGQDPRGVWGVDSKIRNAILGNWPLELPNGVHISTVLDGVTSTSLGRDEQQRPIWASSYPFRVYRPGAHRA